jgi:hypothetical protein
MKHLKFSKKNSLIIAAKKYDPVPQFFFPIAKTSKCFNRVHPKHDNKSLISFYISFRPCVQVVFNTDSIDFAMPENIMYLNVKKFS